MSEHAHVTDLVTVCTFGPRMAVRRPLPFVVRLSSRLARGKLLAVVLDVMDGAEEEDAGLQPDIEEAESDDGDNDGRQDVGQPDGEGASATPSRRGKAAFSDMKKGKKGKAGLAYCP